MQLQRIPDASSPDSMLAMQMTHKMARLTGGGAPAAFEFAVRRRMCAHAEIKAVAAADAVAAVGDAIAAFVSRPPCQNCENALTHMAQKTLGRCIYLLARTEDTVRIFR